MNLQIKSLALILLMLSVGCKRVKQTEVTIKADQNKVYVPLTIADTTIMMLWSTAADFTSLSVELAEKLGVECDTKNILKVSDDLGVNSSISTTGNLFAYQGDKVRCKIGNEPYTLRPIISNAYDENAILGNDFISKHYSAVHLTEKYLSISNIPLSFAKYDIVDSVVLSSNTNGHIYRVKIESDSLNLLFDSGFLASNQYNDSSYVYYDIILSARDSTNIAFKVFNDIKMRARANMMYYFGDRVVNSVYDSMFNVNSHQITSYIPFFMSSTNRVDIDGYITYGFMARFDIAYYDPYKKTMKLYKIKDYRSIMRDLSIWEYMKGVKGAKIMRP